MATYLIAAENSGTASFAAVVRELGGQFIYSAFGILWWPDAADALCRRLEKGGVFGRWRGLELSVACRSGPKVLGRRNNFSDIISKRWIYAQGLPRFF